ncbi:NAD(+) synthase [Labrenzia sp. R4_2]|uniref:NAD(+) synthase n=1 Tax=Labrenzia sp. R4_2 TaxID=2821107 RepID=UPI001AD9DC39|nr:NAD(+) synthase [Labrenzia sp. R4_2]MBO9422131.1 NAD(+) synthase [Labrenzia sp. R4_2]
MTNTTPVDTKNPSITGLHLDPAAETEKIVAAIRKQLRVELKKRGLVLGLSGGVDSSVCAALAARAVGAKNVHALFMPEADSDPESLSLGDLVAKTFGINSEIEDISSTLRAMKCYERRDACIQRLVPEYGKDWKSKIVISNSVQGQGYNIFFLVVEDPDGNQKRLRMPTDVYLGIVAATNMKQRTRKQLEYYHADRLNFAVLGTPNRLEYDQGFFVKNGDGAADIKPIAHLYKTQVYQLARYLDVPEEICSRPPTTDTFSLQQSQEEFYFSLPYKEMDICLFGLNNGVSVDQVAAEAGLTTEQVENAWTGIQSKRKGTAYLHKGPCLVTTIDGFS